MLSRDSCRVLHIVANYPDGVFQQPITYAVKNLIEATSDHLDHYVVSISRTLNPLNEYVIRGEKILSISYFGLPAAIGQSNFLRKLARRIGRELDDIGLEYDIIHGHKLTVEALVAFFLTSHTEKPYVCTVRGLTDGRIMRWRPDRRGIYKRVIEKTSVVFFPAPWTQKLIDKLLKIESKSSVSNKYFNYTFLPNIVKVSENAIKAGLTRKNRFVTVFREGRGKIKGFRKLLIGLVAAKIDNKKIELDVIGCDSESTEANWVKEFNLSDQVKFLGIFNNAETVAQISQYRGFILISPNETFGMVYTEALLSGVPILYSADTGIDGYLDDLDVGVRVDPFDQNSINNGINNFNEIADDLRNKLRIYLAEGRFDFFRQASIASNYCQAIESCLEKYE